jgi:hypothetical protein
MQWFGREFREDWTFDQMAESAIQVMRGLGMGDEQIERIIGWHQQVMIDGVAAHVPPAPSPAEDRATIAKSEKLLRENRAAYFADNDLQIAAHEARERLAASSATLPPPSQAPATARMSREEYWKHGPGSLPLAASSPAPATPAGRIERPDWNYSSVNEAPAISHHSPASNEGTTE